MTTACWLCNNKDTVKKNSKILLKLEPSNLEITDSQYGYSLPRFECVKCGFIFCPDVPNNVGELYKQMVDEDYSRGERGRMKQSREIVRFALKTIEINSIHAWADLGCGVGSLIQVTNDLKINSVGVELSDDLARYAMSLDRNVQPGDITLLKNSSFDVISIIDVIEHVPDPMNLLRQISEKVVAGGYLIVSTPDENSFMSKMLGRYWWHIRPAHVGYFNKNTIEFALMKSGFEPVAWSRPTWFFSINYLITRLLAYMPRLLSFPLLSKFWEVYIPVNIRDSWLVIAKKIDRI
jgi:2-polyprenyl-3-methyl-5-hydroxy-6-metoxy-1,4-benzoquinol methylase